MATDSTLQKIADNLLAQFDKTLLDNSTDFSSCDQILNAAPSEHKGGLESLYCDLLLDALISGYYRYSEMDTKQLVDDPLYTKFKKMVYGLDRSDPYNLLYYAIIDLVSGKKENVLQYLSAYLDEKIKSLKTESGIFTAEDFTYILVVPLKGKRQIKNTGTGMICTPFTGHPVEGVLLCGTHMSTKGNV